VLLLGLGCENNQMKSFIEQMGGAAKDRFRFFNAQEVDDELETGVNLVCELSEYASQFKREPIPARELVLGMKCGGSDGFSGITANPLVGRVADKLAAEGGTAILTEVPEMFGAEKVLLDRAGDSCVYNSTIQMVNEFRNYFRKHNEPIDENPSPGNKAGGITTLAEKSLGCVQKSGSAPIRQVLAYGERATPGTGGIALLNGPGNDGVSGSALCASGAHMILFTTGRGNPMGFPVPTIKIASNTPLAQHKKEWIDFNAGSIADGAATIEEIVEPLFDLVLAVASGRKRTRNEINGYREIAIWKDGVTL
jgi:altronate hydrolase